MNANKKREQEDYRGEHLDDYLRLVVFCFVTYIMGRSAFSPFDTRVQDALNFVVLYKPSRAKALLLQEALREQRGAIWKGEIVVEDLPKRTQGHYHPGKSTESIGFLLQSPSLVMIVQLYLQSGTNRTLFVPHRSLPMR